MHLISVIIPFYNVAATVERCLLSVFNQTYKQLEIILVDDRGQDNSAEIIHTFIEKHNWTQARVIVHPENKGLSGARNTGVREAKGDYVYFLDSDDEIIPETFELLGNLALKYQAEMVQGNFQYVPAKWNDVYTMDAFDGPEFWNDNVEIKKAMLARWPFPVMATNKLISRNFMVQNDLFFKEGIIHEDAYWNFFLAKKLRSVALCKAATYVYYQNFEGITIANKDKSRHSMKLIVQDFAHNLDKVCLEEQKRTVLYYVDYSDVEFVKIAFSMYKNPNVIKVLNVLEGLHRNGLFTEKMLAMTVNLYIRFLFFVKADVNYKSI